MNPFVKHARDMALRLLSEEYEFSGSTDAAMRRVARRCNVPYRALWALRYRAPKHVLADVYFNLKTAYEATRAAHEVQLRDEFKLREEAGRADAPLVRAARTLGGCDDGR